MSKFGFSVMVTADSKADFEHFVHELAEVATSAKVDVLLSPVHEIVQPEQADTPTS